MMTMLLIVVLVVCQYIEYIRWSLWVCILFRYGMAFIHMMYVSIMLLKNNFTA